MDNVSAKSIKENKIYFDVKKVIEEKRKLKIKIPKINATLKDDYNAYTPKISHREVVIFI